MYIYIYLNHKLFSNVIFARFRHSPNSNHIFCKEQMSFGKNESTSSALVSITEDIREIVDTGMKVCSVLLDVAKLCNNVKHDTLIQKME